MNVKKNVDINRMRYIDFLKFIGITAIMLAHVGAPKFVMAIRSFDVPLMVILSAILGEKSFQNYRNNQKSFVCYYISRIKRLVFPTWFFLVLYFGICYVVSGSFYNIECYIASFCLTRYGIGYVWVILIYLYSALLIPFFNKIKLSKAGIIFVAAIYLLYEVACYFQIGVDSKLIDTTFYTFIPYGVITYLGYNYRNIKKNNRYLIAIAAFMIFVGFGILYWNLYGTPQPVGIVKYPPKFYYLGYGVAVSFLLLLICEGRNLSIYNNRVIRYVSKNSLWIYLWHILMLDIYNNLGLPQVWYVKILFVYISSSIIVLLVNTLLDKIKKNPLKTLDV